MSSRLRLVPTAECNREVVELAHRKGYRAGYLEALRLVADGEITQRTAWLELERRKGQSNVA